MTRKEFLHLLVLQARANGFELRKWFQSKIERQWTSPEAAIVTLASGNRYYALLFSHEFAQAFWKQGTQMQFVVPTQHFTRLNARGQMVTRHPQGIHTAHIETRCLEIPLARDGSV